jgi:hypothetical protein
MPELKIFEFGQFFGTRFAGQFTGHQNPYPGAFIHAISGAFAGFWTALSKMPLRPKIGIIRTKRLFYCLINAEYCPGSHIEA